MKIKYNRLCTQKAFKTFCSMLKATEKKTKYIFLFASFIKTWVVNS